MKKLLALILVLFSSVAQSQSVKLSNGTLTHATNYLLNYTNTISPSGWNIAQSNQPPATNTTPGSQFCCYVGNQFWILKLDQAITSSTWTNGHWVVEIESNGCTNSNQSVCLKYSHPTYPQYYTSGSNKCGNAYTTYTTAIASDLSRLAATLGEPAHNSGFGYLDYSEAVGIPDGSVYQNCGGGSCSHDYGLTKFGDVVSNPAICAFSSQFGVNITTDAIVLPPGRLPDIPVLASLSGADIGFIYEPGDDRSCPTTTAFFQSAAALIANANTLGSAPSYHYGFLLNANQIASNGKGFTFGICPNFAPNANTDTILGLITAWYLGLNTGTQSPEQAWQVQLSYFNSPIPSKIGVRYWMTYGITGVSTFYTDVTSPTKYYGVYLTPNGVPQGCNNVGTLITAVWSGINSPATC